MRNFGDHVCVCACVRLKLYTSECVLDEGQAWTEDARMREATSSRLSTGLCSLALVLYAGGVYMWGLSGTVVLKRVVAFLTSSVLPRKKVV